MHCDLCGKFVYQSLMQYLHRIIVMLCYTVDPGKSSFWCYWHAEHKLRPDYLHAGALMADLNKCRLFWWNLSILLTTIVQCHENILSWQTIVQCPDNSCIVDLGISEFMRANMHWTCIIMPSRHKVVEGLIGMKILSSKITINFN